MGKIVTSAKSQIPEFNISEDEILKNKVIVTALQSSDILLSVLKLNGTYIYANESHERVLQYTPDELIGTQGFDLIHPEDRKMLMLKAGHYTKKFINITLRNFLSGEKNTISESVEYRIKDKTGAWHWFESVGSIVEGRMYGISREITKIKKTGVILEEASKYNKLRAEVWKIAADKALSEDELIQKLLNLIGPSVNLSRACYNRFTGSDPYKSDLKCVLEWCAKKAKPTLNSKLPSILFKYFLKEEFTYLTPKIAISMIPMPQKIVVTPLIHAMAKTQNLHSISILPHYINGKVVGILAFDICRNKKVKPVWTEDMISIVKEVVSIVSNHIAQKKAESALAEANTYNKLRAEVWKIASDKNLNENELIQKLLDIIGPAIGVSRACYNKFAGDDPLKNEVECILEWCAEGVGPSIGTKIPNFLVKHFVQEDFFVLTRENADDFVPKKYKVLARPLIKAIIKSLKLESVLVLPHVMNNKIVGLLSFDVCIDNKHKPEWTDNVKAIIKEAVAIVSNHIIQKKVELELKKHRLDLEGLVIKRTVEFVEANKKLKNEIAERKKTEVALNRAEKMEAVGLLASGVAHDLNNILSGVVSCPDLLLHELPKESNLREIVDAIKMSGTKAAAVVQDLLLLSKTSFTDTGVVDLNAVVSGYFESLEFKKLESSRSDISFEIGLEQEKLYLEGSPIHLSKIIMNLIINAAEAIPVSGTISVSTKVVNCENEVNGYETIKVGEYVVLSVNDTGTGISKVDIQRIFEPFYTKKVMNRAGTGLGLSIVWRTMKDHKGFVDIRSEEHIGTTFDLYFPSTTKKTDFIQKVVLEPEEYKGRGEKILVVDDIEEQRIIAYQLLTKLNYKVTTVSSGLEAVE